MYKLLSTLPTSSRRHVLLPILKRELSFLTNNQQLSSQNVIKSLNQKQVQLPSTTFPLINHQNVQYHRVINREYAAVCGLLRRSGLHDCTKISHPLGARGFRSTSSNHQKTPKDDKDPKKPNRDDDDDKDKLSAVLAKAFLWMLTAYMIIAMISLLFPSSNQPEVRKIGLINGNVVFLQPVEHSQVVRFVSWNEFLYHMLAKGEVEEIIVRPDIELVTIILYDGAVIKGKKVYQIQLQSLTILINTIFRWNTKPTT